MQAFGLSEHDVLLSRQQYGSNRLHRGKRRGFFARYLDSFGDPIIKVLLCALAINVVFLFRGQDWYESVGIAVAVLLATFVSTLSEYGSEAAFEKLQEEAAAVHCRVRRGGRLCSVPIDDVVVGDIVLLQSGERIPADGVLIEGVIRADESSINGESRESEKRVSDEFSASSPDALFRGAVVCSGEGVMRVCRVGGNTVYGTIAAEIQEETRISPLKLRLEGLARTLSRIGFVAAGLVAAADLFSAFALGGASPAVPTELVGALLHAATLALTVIVVAVPEGLPMMITVVLSSNMRRMLRDQVLVRKLVGSETSGSLNILFTDKPGTLTVLSVL